MTTAIRYEKEGKVTNVVENGQIRTIGRAGN